MSRLGGEEVSDDEEEALQALQFRVQAGSPEAAEEGATDKQVCDELGISVRQLSRWRDELHLLGADAFPGRGHSRDEEITKLKRENAKLRQERDFLKDAAVFFARESK